MPESFHYLVIEGPIGVGKTSLANKLAQEFGSELLLEKAEENPFLANFYQNPRQYALSAQLHFLLQRAQQVQDFRQSDLFHRSYIADFMVDKDRLFAQMTLNPDELELYEQIYQHLTLDAPRPDLVIYLQAPLETLRERITRRGIDYEQQIRDEYLLRLSESYTRFFYDYDDSALLTVNTRSVDLINNDEDYQAIVEKINDIHSGRHYFNQSSFAL
ncbi:MAG: deoxynucleoside kinase [Gammaproteobacteria bacterium]|nr:MAG: deoxynucleoside kinase [Gammaproteobacteria bacterium]UCH40211.1 MAG: deoxynucleoside kinase [Gammaproteobacteria bacterium]